MVTRSVASIHEAHPSLNGSVAFGRTDRIRIIANQSHNYALLE